MPVQNIPVARIPTYNNSSGAYPFADDELEGSQDTTGSTNLTELTTLSNTTATESPLDPKLISGLIAELKETLLNPKTVLDSDGSSSSLRFDLKGKQAKIVVAHSAGGELLQVKLNGDHEVTIPLAKYPALDEAVIQFINPKIEEVVI